MSQVDLSSGHVTINSGRGDFHYSNVVPDRYSDYVILLWCMSHWDIIGRNKNGLEQSIHSQTVGYEILKAGGYQIVFMGQHRMRFASPVPPRV